MQRLLLILTLIYSYSNAQNIVIKADKISIDLKKNHLTLQENVQAITGEYHLYTNKVLVILDSQLLIHSIDLPHKIDVKKNYHRFITASNGNYRNYCLYLNGKVIIQEKNDVSFTERLIYCKKNFYNEQ